MDAWAQKSNWVFYHCRKTASICNSTIFRHALPPGGHAETLMAQNMGSNNTNNNTNFNHVIQGFRHQPVSIGFDIPYEDWQQKFINSKFCLVIRRDSPGSRSLFRAICAGCMPVIVSDQLPHFQPIYISTFPDWNDFALVVPEDIFLADPVGSLDAAVDALTQSKLALERKLRGCVSYNVSRPMVCPIRCLFPPWRRKSSSLLGATSETPLIHLFLPAIFIKF